MTLTAKELGKKGEELAKKHLSSNGYHILETNYRVGKMEVDIIAKKDDLIVFVEVKTRFNEYLGPPSSFVTLSKQRHIIRVAHRYLSDNDFDNEVRFDIFGIILNNTTSKFNHIENAFYPI